MSECVCVCVCVCVHACLSVCAGTVECVMRCLGPGCVLGLLNALSRSRVCVGLLKALCIV